MWVARKEGNYGQGIQTRKRKRETGGEWFRDDVSTALSHLDTMVYKPGCRAIYMEQDQLLLRVDDYLDDVG